MKIKPCDTTGGVVVKLEAKETQLPTPERRTAELSPSVFQLKRILVPVDFSDCSTKALQYAIPLARQFGAELTLLYMLQSYPVVTDALPVPVESIEDAQRDIEELRAKIGDDIPSRALARVGDPHVGIIDTAKELNIDLIILSTHGRTGLERVLLGSTAEKVVRHAGCPVLVVRQREHEFIVGNPDKPCSTD